MEHHLFLILLLQKVYVGALTLCDLKTCLHSTMFQGFPFSTFGRRNNLTVSHYILDTCGKPTLPSNTYVASVDPFLSYQCSPGYMPVDPDRDTGFLSCSGGTWITNVNLGAAITCTGT